MDNWRGEKRNEKEKEKKKIRRGKDKNIYYEIEKWTKENFMEKFACLRSMIQKRLIG